MNSDNIERILNVDLILRRIVGYLQPRDLRAASLVSRLISELFSVRNKSFCFRNWETILTRREFWDWATVNVCEENVCSIVQSERIKLVGQVNIQRSAVSARTVGTLFNFFSTCSHLKARKLVVTGGLDLSFLPPDILSKSLVREPVNL